MDLLAAVFVGAVATVTMDAWSALRARLFARAGLDYALVGRWLLYLARGRLRHAPISASPALRAERALGWSAHYGIGIGFAALLLSLSGSARICPATPWPALGVGVLSVAAPFLLMQPSMGLGVAASRSPRPSSARLHSLLSHTLFGAGLYLGQWLLCMAAGWLT